MRFKPGSHAQRCLLSFPLQMPQRQLGCTQTGGFGHEGETQIILLGLGLWGWTVLAQGVEGVYPQKH